MAKRPGRIYREVSPKAYTRKEYMGGVPGSRIIQFDLGAKHTEFPVTADLVAEEQCQITHNALEASRVAANRVLLKNCGMNGYHLKVRTYPHHVLRENKQAVGAGADRVSDGMRKAFGKAIGVAARVDRDQAIMTVRTTVENFDHLKEAFRKANMKLPTPTRLKVTKGADLVL